MSKNILKLEKVVSNILQYLKTFSSINSGTAREEFIH